MSISTNIIRNKTTPNFINGLTFGLFNWGDINVPINVSLSNIRTKIGTISDDNLLSYNDAESFCNVASNINVYRVYPSLRQTFFATDDTIGYINGVSNAHLIVKTNEVGGVKHWNKVDNGEDVYLNLSSKTDYENLPTYLTNEVLFISAKYTGSFGNNIRVSIFSYLDDLDDYIMGDDISNSPYAIEYINGDLKVNEFLIFVMIDGNVVENRILSTNINDENYIDSYEFEYIDVYYNENITPCTDDSSDLAKSQSAPSNLVYQRLEKGFNGYDAIVLDDYNNQLNKLKSRWVSDFRLMYFSGNNEEIIHIVSDIAKERPDAIFGFCVHGKLNRINAFGNDSFGLMFSGDSDILGIDLTTFYKDINTKNCFLINNYSLRNFNGSYIEVSPLGILMANILKGYRNNNIISLTRDALSGFLISVNEMKSIKYKELKKYRVNMIRRNHDRYYLYGDDTLTKDRWTISEILIENFIISKLYAFAESVNGATMNDKIDIQAKKISLHIRKAISNLTTDFNIKTIINKDGYDITMNVEWKINDKYSGISINLQTA